MSSGYCSLEEELEDCFFTAKTTFFKNVQSKQSAKVNLLGYERLAGRGWGCVRAGHPLWSRRAALLPQTGRARCYRVGGQLPGGPLELGWADQRLVPEPFGDHQQNRFSFSHSVRHFLSLDLGKMALQNLGTALDWGAGAGGGRGAGWPHAHLGLGV